MAFLRGSLKQRELWDASTFRKRRLLTVRVDQHVRSAIDDLVIIIAERFNDTLPEIEESIQLCNVAGSSDFADLLDAEYVKVQDKLKALPWWDTWTFAHWVGQSKTLRFQRFRNVLRKQDSEIRIYAENIEVVCRNLEFLRTYMLWYPEHLV